MRALLFTHTNVGWSIFPCPVNRLAASKKGKKINLRLQTALPALMAHMIPDGSSGTGWGLCSGFGWTTINPSHPFPGRSCTAQHWTHKKMFLMDIIRRKIPPCSRLLQGLLTSEGSAAGLSFAGRQEKQRTNACQTAVELERMKCSYMGRKDAFHV